MLSKILWSPERYRLNKQIDYDYSIAKENFDDSKLGKQEKIEIPKRPEISKTPKIESTQKNTTTSNNKRNEGIFRNF